MLTEKQRKALLEAIQDPKNSKKTLEEWTADYDEYDDPTNASWYTNEEERLEYEVFRELDMDPNEVSDEDAERVANAIYTVYDQLKFDGRPEDVQIVVKQLFDKNSLNLDKAESVKENKKFDYKQYLTEGWLLQEAKAPQQKDLYKNRADRASKGNWKGSIGKYVETRGEELKKAFESGTLRHYVQTKMKSALKSEEDRKYLENIEVSSKTDMKLYSALYNIALKGAGLGGEKAHGINVSSKK